jgi:zinc finger CCHC domain-containing protein 9
MCVTFFFNNAKTPWQTRSYIAHVTAAAVADKVAASSEARRLKRIAERSANKTCFACREIGHSAKDCQSLRPDEANESSDRAMKTKTVGICYRCAPHSFPLALIVLRLMTRCGSRKHNLARCREPARPDNPLPFASCFVCTGRGHLASSCPKNEGKGVYPNGGSCKLCGETTHLAKNCTLRKIGQCPSSPRGIPRASCDDVLSQFF